MFRTGVTQLKTVGLHFSLKKGKYTRMYGGPPQATPRPTAEDISALKLKHACTFCGERRFVNLAGRLQHERTCDIGRAILHPGRFDVEAILDVRGPPDNRFYHVKWTPGQLGANETWEPRRNLGDYCNGVISEWFTTHPEWHLLDDVELEGEIRCNRCNRRDFASRQLLERHKRSEHTPPVITGTLAYKRAQHMLQTQTQSRLPKLVIDGQECDN